MKRISLKSGTFSMMHGSSVSSVAAKMGKQEFLAPLTVTDPFNGNPPWICRVSMECISLY